VETLEILEEGRLNIEPPAEEPATGEVFIETTAAEGVTPLKITAEDMAGSNVDFPVVLTVVVSSAYTAAPEDISHTESLLLC